MKISEETPLSLSLIDTNILVYAHFEEAVHHAVSLALLDRAQAGELALCVTSQVLAEFYSVVTSPKRVTSPFTPEEAVDAIEQIATMPGMTILSAPADVLSRWLDLARKHPVSGARIFDLQLIAGMQANGVATVYTFDSAHFEPFDGIGVLTP